MPILYLHSHNDGSYNTLCYMSITLMKPKSTMFSSNHGIAVHNAMNEWVVSNLGQPYYKGLHQLRRMHSYNPTSKDLKIGTCVWTIHGQNMQCQPNNFMLKRTKTRMKPFDSK